MVFRWPSIYVIFLHDDLSRPMSNKMVGTWYISIVHEHVAEVEGKKITAYVRITSILKKKNKINQRKMICSIWFSFTERMKLG